MSKQIKERVQAGTATHGKPIYKWATGSIRQEVLIHAAKPLYEGCEICFENTQTADKHLFKDYAQPCRCGRYQNSAQEEGCCHLPDCQPPTLKKRQHRQRAGITSSLQCAALVLHRASPTYAENQQSKTSQAAPSSQMSMKRHMMRTSRRRQNTTKLPSLSILRGITSSDQTRR